MQVGDLVASRHDNAHRGIVMEVGPLATRIDHGKFVVRIQWFDGEETYEFNKMLEVLSEGK